MSHIFPRLAQGCATCEIQPRSGTLPLYASGGEGERMNENFQQILQMGQQVQARLSQLQAELGQKTVSCSSGGGMVTVTADGRGKVRSIKIDPSVVDASDVEMLEDLVIAAVTEAQTRANSVYEEEMRKLSGGLPLPFQLPDF
jgi:nucleoid-associated protein EbfC